MTSFIGARALLEKVAGRNSQLATDQSRLANCYAEIGILQGNLESGDHGLDMLEKAKAIQQQLIGPGPGDFAKRQRLAEMIDALGYVYFKRIDFPAAIRCFQQVQEICVSLMGEITDGPKPSQTSQPPGVLPLQRGDDACHRQAAGQGPSVVCEVA